MTDTTINITNKEAALIIKEHGDGGITLEVVLPQANDDELAPICVIIAAGLALKYNKEEEIVELIKVLGDKCNELSDN